MTDEFGRPMAVGGSRKRRPRESPATPEEIGRLLIRLCKSVDLLQRDMHLVAERLRPLPGEESRPREPWFNGIADSLERATAPQGVLLVLERLQQVVEDSVEPDIRAIRSKIEQASLGAYTRDNNEPYRKR